MKDFKEKYGMVLLIILFIVAISLLTVLTASKDYSTVCKLETADPAGDYNMKATYTIVHNKAGYVKTVEITEEYTELKEGILDELNTTTKLLNSTFKNTYGGYTFENDKDDDLLTVSTTIDFETIDLEKYSSDMGLSDYVEDGKIHKDAFVNKYERNGATCK